MAGLKICVAGVGALGGTLAAMLARTEASLSVVARGATLQALHENGLVLDDGQDRSICHPIADTRAPDCHQDVILLAGKSHQLSQLAETVRRAVGRQTLVIPVVNGLPWWMATDPNGAFEAAAPVLDPDGRLSDLFSRSCLVGAVAYAMTEQTAPGVVSSARAPMLVLGMVDGMPDDRLSHVLHVLQQAGITARSSPQIRCDIWNKIAANLATNPLSVVCEASLSTLAGAVSTEAVIADILKETLAVGTACGLSNLHDVDEIRDTIAKAGPHRTSMLQDYCAGRILELDAIGWTIAKIGQAHDVPMPVTSTVLELATFKAAQRVQAQGIRS